MNKYIDKKYSGSYTEFSLCHVELELLVCEKEARAIVRQHFNIRAVGQYWHCNRKDFIDLVATHI